MSAAAVVPTQRRLAVVSLVAGLGGAAAVGLGNPYRGGVLPPCPLRALTGFDCPGCGATRATHELLHGQLAAAFDLNPLFVILLPIALYAYASWAARELFGWSWPRIRLRPVHPLVALGVLLAYGVARNLPFDAVGWMGT